MTHPNIIAGCIREAAALWGSEDFDPDNGQDVEWLTKTFDVLMGLASRVPSDAPAPAPVPQAPEQFQQQVEQAFPGAVPVNPEPFPAPAAVPAGTPQAPGGALHTHSHRDEQWASLIMELQANGGQLQNWWDNRVDKRSPTSPDFRHKAVDAPPNRAGRVYKLGLYLKDAPDFALQALAQYPPR